MAAPAISTTRTYRPESNPAAIRAARQPEPFRTRPRIGYRRGGQFRQPMKSAAMTLRRFIPATTLPPPAALVERCRRPSRRGAASGEQWCSAAKELALYDQMRASQSWDLTVARRGDHCRRGQPAAAQVSRH
jgi:hypothetical protein